MVISAMYGPDCCGIYLVRHVASGRLYVGSSVRIWVRWLVHKSELRRQRHHSDILQKAWNKYGEAAFVCEIVEAVSAVNDLIKREQWWIDALDSANRERGFNRSPAAGSRLGIKSAPETIVKFKKTRRGMPIAKYTPERKAALSERQRGRPRPEATRLKMSLGQIGKKNGPPTKEHKAKISAALSGRILPKDQLF